eukprot:TRINITY_DN71989_c0_g1_i1.p1 TRINITY_DN71989_c0_g1~~TRINITY_DN71989_c0_g1_i1.p1  ORF type:complete len:664 (-),score=115.88 TRINITY_DN71989_c0_g1_i1:81-2072(-)
MTSPHALCDMTQEVDSQTAVLDKETFASVIDDCVCKQRRARDILEEQESLLVDMLRRLAQASDDETQGADIELNATRWEEQEEIDSGLLPALQESFEYTAAREANHDTIEVRFEESDHANEMEEQVVHDEAPPAWLTRFRNKAYSSTSTLSPTPSNATAAVPQIGQISAIGLQGKRHSIADIVKEKASRPNMLVLKKYFWLGLSECLHRLEAASAEEPVRSGFLARVLHSSFFTSLIASVILLNSAFLVITTNYEIQNPGQTTQGWMLTAELCFSAVYLVEVILRLSVQRCYFFINKDAVVNIFDLVLVVTALVEHILVFQIMSESSNDSSSGMNLSVLRLLRVCKFLKVLRVFRTIRFFSELRLMLDCVLGSFLNLVWCTLMLFFVIFIFALLIVQGISVHLEKYPDDPAKTSMLSYFSSVDLTIITLFMMTTGGLEWRAPYSSLASTGPVLQIVLVAFISLATISLWNIVTSSFVEKALKLAQPDIDSLVMEKQVSDYNDSQMLVSMFVERLHLSDYHSPVSAHDFQRIAEDDEFLAYLSAGGIDIKNARLFYKLLASLQDAGNVDAITLANSCVRMKGVATSLDLQLMQFETKLMIKEHSRALRLLQRKLKTVDKKMSELLELLQQQGPGHVHSAATVQLQRNRSIFPSRSVRREDLLSL